MALSQKHQRLGRTIRKLREEHNLTLEELAHEADIDTSFLGYIERGERNITTEKLFRVAKALKVKISDLFESL